MWVGIKNLSTGILKGLEVFMIKIGFNGINILGTTVGYIIIELMLSIQEEKQHCLSHFMFLSDKVKNCVKDNNSTE